MYHKSRSQSRSKEKVWLDILNVIDSEDALDKKYKNKDSDIFRKRQNRRSKSGIIYSTEISSMQSKKRFRELEENGFIYHLQEKENGHTVFLYYMTKKGKLLLNLLRKEFSSFD